MIPKEKNKIRPINKNLEKFDPCLTRTEGGVSGEEDSKFFPQNLHLQASFCICSAQYGHFFIKNSKNNNPDMRAGNQKAPRQRSPCGDPYSFPSMTKQGALERSLLPCLD